MKMKEFFSKCKSILITVFAVISAIITGAIIGKNQSSVNYKLKSLKDIKENEKSELEKMDADTIVNNSDNKSELLNRKDEIRKESNERLRQSIREYLNNNPIK